MATATATAFQDRNPFPGPRSFCRDERAVFRGRWYESRELFSLVVAHKVVLLYSQSGAGKTSLLNAGLMPLLQEEGFKIFPVARVAGRIPDSLSVESVPNPYTLNVLLSWSEQERGLAPDQLATASLRQFLAANLGSCAADRHTGVRVLVFDQFEELFTFYPERWKQRGEFIEQLAEAVAADDYLRVVIGMREEYLGPLQVHAVLLPESLETTFRLERLGKEEALAAITEPLKTTRRRFEPGVAEKLVDELLKIKVAVDHNSTVEVAGEYVEPVQLQVVCSGLWDKLPAETTQITFKHLEDFGDVTDALSCFYEDSLKDASQKTNVTEGRLRKWFQQALVTPAGTRSTVFRGATETGGLPNAAVDALEAKHIVRCDSRAGSAWYELTHDRFLDPVLKSNARWRQAHGAAEIVRRALEEKAETWEHSGRPDKQLLSGQKLLEAQHWLDDPKALELGCSDNVLTFITISATRQKDRQRRRQIFALVFGAACILCFALFLMKAKELRMARDAEIRSKIAMETMRNRAFQILRERQLTLSRSENNMALLDALIKKSSPEEAADWHLQKSELLLQQERFDDALKEINTVIDVAPDYADARTSRSYTRMLQNRSNEALADLEYIRDKLNAKDTLNYLNLTIVYAQLGREPEAQHSLDQAIFYSAHGQNSGGSEEVVPPEITEATLRRSLVANGEIFRQALYFMKVVLAASSGGESFLSDLKAAQEQAHKIREDEKQEASLVALTWAWFLERGNKPGYGLSAAQGLLWQEADKPAYAARHFEDFRKAHAEGKDGRYNQLAEWVQQQKVQVSQPEFSFAQDDPVYLEAQSELLRVQGRYQDAERILDQAIKDEPENARLYFDRMNVYYQELTDPNNHSPEVKNLRDKFLADCEYALQLPGAGADAYYERAIAKSYLGKPNEEVIRDLQQAVELEPNHESAIRELSYLTDQAAPTHPELSAKWYNLYHNLFPAADPEMLARRAVVQVKMKQFADAYDTIQKAIALDPADYSYYKTRADAERGLGFTEVQIQRDWAEGDRAAADHLRRRGHPEDHDAIAKWENDRWSILAKFGEQFSGEQTRCNGNATTCVIFKVTHDHGEWAYLKIVEVQKSQGNKRVVRIDRGTNDGVVLGPAGEVYSPPSLKNGHERKPANIGAATILSIDPDSALLMVTMTNPTGDGLVRVGDAVGVSVRTPDVKERSRLWPVLNSSIALMDRNGTKIADFRTLYSDESPELDQRIYQRLLEDVHETGRLYGDQIDEGKPITAVRLGQHPRRLRQILEETTRDDLDRFFEYVVKFRASYFGQDWKIGWAYADWVKSGMTDE